jgi:hypothetical protein
MTDFTHAAQFVVNLLAVGGGFLAGFWVSTLLAWGVDRLTHRASPRSLHKLVRFLGGVIGAVLVALIVFGHGRGWNLFGGAAPGTGSTDGQNPTGEVQTVPMPAPPDRVVTSAITTVGEAPARICIKLLGGADVKDKKFYCWNDEPQPLNLEEVKTRVRAQIDTATSRPGIGVDVVFAKQNRLPPEHPAVLQLTQWLRNVAGLAVNFPPDPR